MFSSPPTPVKKLNVILLRNSITHNMLLKERFKCDLSIDDLKYAILRDTTLENTMEHLEMLNLSKILYRKIC